jgi:hypothetical protein
MVWTAETLPKAIGQLLELNNYAVAYSVKVAGGEVDIVATSISDPLATPLYIEATIEYVNNTKYGKDVSKFIAIQNINPSAQCICVSSSGFTPDVKERATASRIKTFTYDELFRMFEKFSTYVDFITNDTELFEFNNSYEEPTFVDNKGEDQATTWLTNWRDSSDPQSKWLIVLGEYGTGKTSLSKVLQYRWTAEYKLSPSSPIPFRIELRSFSRQFDGRTLLHHFLDTNHLGHIPIDFVYHLMRNGRIILILDGYDEMAQFLSPRERRACLGTLADLAGQGAKGILTSRPNYFTETEELRVFETLYATLEQNKYYLGASDKEYLATEKSVDTLITRYLLDRYERDLSDLNQEQTISLVRRKLSGDIEGQALILGLLHRVFREETGRNKVALSGKPVIIAYLLELVDDLRKLSEIEGSVELTEWDVYKMIVDRLMLRDQQRSPLDPQRRRKTLQRLAIAISSKESRSATESVLKDVIDAEFHSDFRLMAPDERRHRRDELFEDIRGSATLTRGEGDANTWVFSHNSLREYLSTEYWIGTLISSAPTEIQVPISVPMRTFAAATPTSLAREILNKFQEAWLQRHTKPEIGPYLTLLWELITASTRNDGTPVPGLGPTVDGAVFIDGVRCSQVDFATLLETDKETKVHCASSELSEVSFAELNLASSNFSGAIMDSVSFRGANLREADFGGAFLFENDFSNTDVEGANFSFERMKVECKNNMLSGSHTKAQYVLCNSSFCLG